jgi:hypothetical protein
MTLNHFCQSALTAVFCALLTMTARSNPQSKRGAQLNPCQFRQLSVRRGDASGAMGHIGKIYAFENISSSSCTLSGYPGFVPLNAKGQPLQGVKTTWSLQNYMHRAQKQKITLLPGKLASFEVVYNHVSSNDRSCSLSAKVAITPPNTDRHFSLAEKIRPCREIFVTPVEAGLIQN